MRFISTFQTIDLSAIFFPDIAPLREQEAKDMIPKLVSALSYKDPEIRTLSAEALGLIGRRFHTEIHLIEPELIKCMCQDSEESVRIASVLALGEMKATNAISLIKADLVTIESRDVKLDFAKALIKMEGRGSEGELIIRKMIDDGELDTAQVHQFEDFINNIEAEEVINQISHLQIIKQEVSVVKEEVVKVREIVEQLEEDDTQQELLARTLNQEQIINSVEEKVDQLNESLTQLITDSRETPRFSVPQLQELATTIAAFKGSKNWWLLILVQLGYIIIDFIIEKVANTAGWFNGLNIGLFVSFLIISIVVIVISFFQSKGETS
ncbi:MAG: HEAT repeat domain-containing protein [Candidatus Heimdallarchaeota archaeon]